MKKNLSKVIVFGIVLSVLSTPAWAADTEFHKETAGVYDYTGAQTADTLYPDAYPVAAGRADAAISGYGAGITMSFDGDVTVNLDAAANAGNNDAHGIGAYNGTTINIAGDKLNITNNASHTNNDNHGIAARTDSVINVNSLQTTINIAGSGRNNAGVSSYDNGAIIFTQPLNINVESNLGIATGILSSAQSRIETDSVQITATAAPINSAQARGITLSESANYKANGDITVTTNASATGSKSIAINNIGTGTVDVQNAKLFANNTGTNGEAYGLFNANANSSYVGKNLDIVASGIGAIWGIQNFGKFSAENVTISIDDHSGQTIGVNNTSTNFYVKNLNINIDNANGRSSTDGLKSSQSITIDGTLQMLLKGGNVNTNGIYMTAGTLTVNGNTDMIVYGSSQNGHVINGNAILNGAVNNLALYDKDGVGLGWGDVLRGTTTIAANSTTNITLLDNKVGNEWQLHGIRGVLNLGDNTILNVRVEAPNALIAAPTGLESQKGVFGISASGTLPASSKTNIIVNGPAIETNGYHGTVGIAGIDAVGDVNVQVLSEKGIGIRALSTTGLYTGELVVNTNNGWALATAGPTNATSKVTINPVADKKVQLTGDIEHISPSILTEGLIDISLKTADSFLTGASLGADNTMAKTTNLSMSNSARWNITADSIITKLETASDATVDLTHGANNLNIYNYSGNSGNFILDTDLNSETDGDKVNITTATPGTTYIQVKDASLTNGVTVTGKKNLLLVTDTSQTATFVGQSLNTGGLWDVLPTIENGLNVTDASGSVIGTADQWYLTKLARVVNNDTSVLLSSSDNSYALWRNTNDTLRKRLGELNYAQDRKSNDGLWARTLTGKFASNSIQSSSYNMYQLGYDKSYNANSTYGIAIESGSARGSYNLGSSNDQLTAVSLYGTWTKENGQYIDLVGKIGWLNSDLKSYGDYPDQVDYSTRGYSLSVEYGQKHMLNKTSGVFIEPQAQIIIGHMSGSNYTTRRGTNVDTSALNSFIGRLGFVLGQKNKVGNETYFKASMLHEFGGKRDINMRSANGETMSTSANYGDTWFEIGLGANLKLSKTSNLYFDVERSLGASIQKKWQLNAGLRAEF